MPERVIREGREAQELLKLIEEDEDIASCARRRHRQGGPGRWSRAWPRTPAIPDSGRHRPGHLSDEDLDTMS
jgi:hypothetical protein